MLPLDEARQKKRGREIRAAAYQKSLLTLSTQKSLSTFHGIYGRCPGASCRSRPCHHIWLAGLTRLPQIADWDIGHGKGEEQMQSAFDPFQQSDRDTSIPVGFGRGLFSAKSLADALGLAVTLRSEAGRGTEVKIFLLTETDAVPRALAA